MSERLAPPAFDTTPLSDRLGLMTEENGLPRSAGRIFGHLLVSEGALSFSDLAAQLGISRGGMSTNTRLLIEMGLIERVTRAGSRQDYFEVPADVWRNQIERQMTRDRKARDHVEAALTGDPALSKAARARLEMLSAILARSNDLCVETLAMIESGTLSAKRG